jgi:hypothetical protein
MEGAGRSASTATFGGTEGVTDAEPKHGCRAFSETADITHFFGFTFDCLTADVHPHLEHWQYA